MMERVFNIVLRIVKNFGYIGLGCTIIGLIEVEEFDDILDKLGEEVWDLCATDEDEIRVSN